MIGQPLGQDAGVEPVERLGFDTLRSLFVARQSSTATVRALVSARTQSIQANTMIAGGNAIANLTLLTGRRHPDAPCSGGAFANHSGPDQPVVTQGESHG